MRQKTKYKKSCVLILEYGIPHYREFLFEHFQESFSNFEILHSGERFSNQKKFRNTRGVNLRIWGEFSLVFFNPIKLLQADIIISTFNIYKPHTWFWVLMMPWKNWILWGQGLGNSKMKLLILFRKFIINLSKGYVVYTQEGKKKLLENNIPDSKITVAGNTLEVKNHELTLGRQYFLYVGRIQERKGLKKLLDTCSKLNFDLVVVGDGILKSEYQNEYSNCKNIYFKDAVYNEDELRSIFREAIAYVSPDHVGLGVVHSFAYGVPVITNASASHAPEFSYCNDENSYLYYEDEELPGLLLEAKEDSAEWLRKSRAAYNYYLQNLSPEKMIKSFDVQFKKIF